MSETPPAPTQPASSPPNLLQVFIAFSVISLSGFGGVLYWSRRMMVEERKWLTAEEFNEAYALCNFLPGPNIVNFSVVFGRQIAGTSGALVALVGLLGPPFAMVTFFGFLYAYYGTIDSLQRMFGGVAAAAAGLTLSTSVKMLQPLIKEGFGTPHVMALAAFAGVGVLRWPIYWVLVVLIPISIAVAWWARR
jgi:chromate transporter